MSREYGQASPANGAMVWGAQEPGPLDDTIAEAQQGDAAAFERLMSRYEHRVYRTCLRLLSNREDAMDAAQDTFVRMHAHLSKFDAQKPLMPWLYRIAVNVCRDHAKKKRKHQALPINDEALQVSARTQTRDILETERDNMLMEAGLQTLSPREREVLVFREVEGMSTREVARIVGSRQTTVRSQLSRAHRKMKAYKENAVRCDHDA